MKNKETLSIISSVLDNFKKTIRDKKMLCASYAYDYEKKKTKTSLEKFYELWNSFSLDDKRMVILHYYSFNDYELLKCVGVENRENANNEIHETIVEFIKTKYFTADVKQNMKK